MLQHQLSWRDGRDGRPADPRDPDDPAYAWPASLDQAVAEGDGYGIRSALMVKRTPDWANGDRGEQWVPTRLRDYADFMVAAARRYPHACSYWMVWGEPTRGDSFKPMPRERAARPAALRADARPAYGALKGVRRSNIVIGGNTWTVGVVSAAEVHALDEAAERQARRASTGSATTRSPSAPRS